MSSPDDGLDGLDALIGAVDPIRNDPPPVRGSTRHRSILETAMTIPTTDADRSDPRPLDDPATPGHRAPNARPARRRWLLSAAAAAILVGVVGAAVAVRTTDRSEPANSTTSAPPPTVPSRIVSFRGEVTITPSDGTGASRNTIRVAGDDSEATATSTYPDGRIESSTRTRVAGFEYETVDGATTRREVPPEQRAVRFDASTSAVVTTLLANSTELGRTDESVDGVATARYDLELTPAAVDALNELPPGMTGWFELEYPEDVESLTVWVTDDVIRQIEVVTPDQTTRTRFFDLNGDITVVAPPGPYADAGS